jgi:hypothetical protein
MASKKSTATPAVAPTDAPPTARPTRPTRPVKHRGYPALHDTRPTPVPPTPADWHPHTIDASHRSDLGSHPIAETVAREAKRALESLYSTDSRMSVAETALSRGADREAQAQFLTSAGRAYDEAVGTVDRVVTSLRGYQSALADEMAGPLRNKDAARLGPEVRAMMRSQSLDERAATVRAALDASDTVTLGAILDGPAALSGMSPAEQALHREHAQRRLAPAAHQASRAVAKVVDRIERARASFTARCAARREKFAPTTAAEQTAAQLTELIAAMSSGARGGD